MKIKNRLKNLLIQLLPPLLKNLIKPFFKTSNFVDYKSWDDASKESGSYSSSSIISRVTKSSKLVFDGKEAYERDSVIFNEIQYSYPLLACLLFCSANCKSLRVLDFGGALGTTFQQNRKFLTELKNGCEWRIVEQKKFVEIGKKLFTNKFISFHYDIKKAAQNGLDVIVFSGSLSYVKNPNFFIAEAIATKAPYIIIDKLQVISGEINTFGSEFIPFYSTSVPIQFFSHNNLLKIFSKDYNLIEEWVSDLQPNSDKISKGFFFRIK